MGMGSGGTALPLALPSAFLALPERDHLSVERCCTMGTQNVSDRFCSSSTSVEPSVSIITFTSVYLFMRSQILVGFARNEGLSIFFSCFRVR